MHVNVNTLYVEMNLIIKKKIHHKFLNAQLYHNIFEVAYNKFDRMMMVIRFYITFSII